jgi:biotin operon repressor
VSPGVVAKAVWGRAARATTQEGRNHIRVTVNEIRLRALRLGLRIENVRGKGYALVLRNNYGD